MRKLKVGDVVEVTFLDHCLVSDGEIAGVLECKAWGRVIGVGKKELAIASWMAGDEVDQNAERVHLVRSAIKKVRVLK